MRFTQLMTIACLGVGSLSAGIINLTYNESFGGLNSSFPNSNFVWTAQFDLATHPVSPFTTPVSTGPFVPVTVSSVNGIATVKVPLINWSGDRIVSIVDATTRDTLNNYTWNVDQGTFGGHPLAPGTSQCIQPCSDSANGVQNWGLIDPFGGGFRLATTVDTWQGAAVSSSVPEPGSVLLAMLGGLALIGRRYLRRDRRRSI